jgi:hypothetical protein
MNIHSKLTVFFLQVPIPHASLIASIHCTSIPCGAFYTWPPMF